jgi:glycosyltransferase involved in cell wall biosynthesis
MKISLYITTFNDVENLKNLLSDLTLQCDREFQVVIVDAGSSDGTPLVLKGYMHFLNLRIISEADRGIYFGLNKAIHLMSTSHCLCLGSDDRIHNKQFISELNKMDLNENKMFYTDISIKGSHSIRDKRFLQPRAFQSEYGGLAHLHHQSALIPYWVLRKYMYDTAYPTYADLDLMLKAQREVSLEKLDIDGVCFNSSGASGSFKSVFKRLTEIIKIRRSNGLPSLNVKILCSFFRQLL